MQMRGLLNCVVPCSILFFFLFILFKFFFNRSGNTFQVMQLSAPLNRMEMLDRDEGLEKGRMEEKERRD